MVSLELIDDCLLEIAIDSQRIVSVKPLFDRLTLDDLPDFGDSPALGSEHRALKSRFSAIRSKDVSQGRVHRIFPDNILAFLLVIGQRAALAIVDPSAQG